MSWQEKLVNTETEQLLYELLEPLFRERTLRGDESLFCILNDLREQHQQKELIEIIKNNTLTPSQIVLRALDIDIRDNPQDYE